MMLHLIIPENLEKDSLRSMTVVNKQFLQIGIFSPEKIIRDFLEEILIYQGYGCVKTGGDRDIVQDLDSSVDHVVFLDGWYLMRPESEGILSRVQLFVQAGGHVVVLADRYRDGYLLAMQEKYGWEILWKPLDYRQVVHAMSWM